MVEKRLVRLALIGVGKIARDQHIPAISAGGEFELCATVDPGGAGVAGVPGFRDMDQLLASGIALDAVSIATPAGVRHDIAAAALAAGLHVMLEKPPAATLSEVADLVRRAGEHKLSLFASWHSREAGGVAPAQAWLAQHTPRRVQLTWKEDIRHWHPGQEWILGPGGFGVFDPGINGLSILTAILPGPFLVQKASLATPEGRASPLKASLSLSANGVPVTAELDFLQTGQQSWDIVVETDDGVLTLSGGGTGLKIGNGAVQQFPDEEYPRLYHRFAELIAGGSSDVDAIPLQLVADSYLVAEHDSLPPFAF